MTMGDNTPVSDFSKKVERNIGLFLQNLKSVATNQNRTPPNCENLKKVQKVEKTSKKFKKEGKLKIQKPDPSVL